MGLPHGLIELVECEAGGVVGAGADVFEGVFLLPLQLVIGEGDVVPDVEEELESTLQVGREYRLSQAKGVSSREAVESCGGAVEVVGDFCRSARRRAF